MYAVGQSPSPLPYGVDVLETNGWLLTSEPQSSHPAMAKTRDVVEHRLGVTVERPLRSVASVASSDLVLALLEREAYLPGLLKRWHVPPFASTPLVIWSCWLADDLKRADRDHRDWLLKRISSADLIAHLSRHETEIFTDAGIPEDRLFAMTYGVSHRYYTPVAGERDIRILAVGQDRGRDYATLIEAVRGTDLVLDLVCKPENLQGLDLPGNVHAHGTVSLPEYRALLRRARIVAVPTIEMAYPTGSSVALEAASSGSAVAVTGTRAMRDYFSDRVNALLIEPGDVGGWREGLHELEENADLRGSLGTRGRSNVVDRHNADHMWTELAAVICNRGLT